MTLHDINPNAYPNPPALTEAEKAENRRWVAQKRAENAAKEVVEPAPTTTVTATPTVGVVGQQRISRDKPTQYRVYTADGWKPIYQSCNDSHNG